MRINFSSEVESPVGRFDGSDVDGEVVESGCRCAIELAVRAREIDGATGIPEDLVVQVDILFTY